VLRWLGGDRDDLAVNQATFLLEPGLVRREWRRIAAGRIDLDDPSLDYLAVWFRSIAHFGMAASRAALGMGMSRLRVAASSARSAFNPEASALGPERCWAVWRERCAALPPAARAVHAAATAHTPKMVIL
jgi:hypothetical protein